MSFTVLLLIILLCGLVAVAMQRNKPSKEHFDDDMPTTEEPSRADGTSAYSNRLYVIKVFDTMFNRNPTHNELEAYSPGPSEKDILDKIVKDYDKLTSPATEVVDVVDGFFADFADASKSAKKQDFEASIPPKNTPAPAPAVSTVPANVVPSSSPTTGIQGGDFQSVDTLLYFITEQLQTLNSKFVELKKELKQIKK